MWMVIPLAIHKLFLSVTEKALLQDTTTAAAAAAAATAAATTTTTTTTTANYYYYFYFGISHIKDKHNSTINSDPSHYLAYAFNNSFLSRIYNSNFQQQRKLKASLNLLNPKIHVDMMKYPLNYLKSGLLMLPHL
jgi:hypothetical protein